MDFINNVALEIVGTIRQINDDESIILKDICPTLEGDWSKATAIYCPKHRDREIVRIWLLEHFGQPAFSFQMKENSTDYERIIDNPTGRWFRSAYVWIRDPADTVFFRLHFTVTRA